MRIIKWVTIKERMHRSFIKFSQQVSKRNVWDISLENLHVDIGPLRVNSDFLFTRENFLASSSEPKFERYTLSSWRLSKKSKSRYLLLNERSVQSFEDVSWSVRKISKIWIMLCLNKWTNIPIRYWRVKQLFVRKMALILWKESCPWTRENNTNPLFPTMQMDKKNIK